MLRKKLLKKMKEAGDVLLKNPDGTGIAILHVEESFSFEKEKNLAFGLIFAIISMITESSAPKLDAFATLG